MTKHPGRDERDATDVDLEAINAMPLYAMYSVFATASPLPSDTDALAAAQHELEATGVTVRGCYDIGGFRADADLMVWTLANDPETLQAGYHALRRSALGDYLEPVWSVMAMHRPSEFNRTHVPSCFAGFAPRPWLTVYPFVQLRLVLPGCGAPLEDAVRARHRGAGVPGGRRVDAVGVRPGDYEWILAFEADERQNRDRRKEVPPAGSRRGCTGRKSAAHRPAGRAGGVDRASAPQLGLLYLQTPGAVGEALEW